MKTTDYRLLNDWRSTSDATAFAELVSRHSPMVCGTCTRILGNPSDAEEITQECFLELLQSKVAIQSSLGGWLHTVATTRALNRLRADGRRIGRESRYAEAAPSIAVPTWDDVRVYVDEAIAALPESLREPIVLRFLEGNRHGAVAENLGLSPSTLRRRLDKGIRRIRESLGKKGIPVSTAVLAAMLPGVPAAALTATATAELGKLALAGNWNTPTGEPGTVAANGVTALGGILVMKKVAVGIGLVIVALILGTWFFNPEISETAAGPPVSVQSEIAPSPEIQRADEQPVQPSIEISLLDDLVIEPEADPILRGTVFNAEGDAVEGATVMYGQQEDLENLGQNFVAFKNLDFQLPDYDLYDFSTTGSDGTYSLSLPEVVPEAIIVIHSDYLPSINAIEPDSLERDIGLARGGSITGVVLMNDMVPPNSIIRISRLDVEWPKTWRVISPEVDEQGAYASELIAPGDYKVSVLYDGKPFLGAGVRYSGTLYRETTVQSEEVVQTDFIVEHGSGGITGRLSASAESGLSMAGPFLFAAALYRIGDIAIEESVEVEDLTYAALDLPAGPVTLFVQTMGSNGVVYHYEDVVIESGTIVKRDINVDAGGAMTINVDPPMTEHTLVIDIERVAGGHYSRSIGDRFPNYTSWLPPFHVYGLAPGTYEVRVFDSANEETPIPLMEPMLFDVTRSEHFIFEIDRSVSETSGDGTTDEGLSD